MLDAPFAMLSFDPLDERYRWCIYYHADCWPEPDNQQHTPDCPHTTGLYPVTEDMVGDRCSYGDGECDHVFRLGEFYMDTEVIDDGRDRTVTVACIGCAHREAVPSGGDG
jgi:hypothetical protein